MVEVLAASAILVITAAAAMNMYVMSQRFWKEGLAMSSLQSSANEIVQRITTHIFLAEEADVQDADPLYEPGLNKPGDRIIFRLKNDANYKCYYLQDDKIYYSDGDVTTLILRDDTITTNRLEFRPMDDVDNPRRIGVYLRLEKNLIGTSPGGRQFTLDVRTMMNRRN